MENVLETVLRSVSLVFAVIFAVAAIHKVRLLTPPRRVDVPLMKIGGLRTRYPVLALSAALILEFALVIALLFAPEYGLLGAALLLLFYARFVAEMPGDEACDCFGGLAPTQTAGRAVWRNLILSSVAVAAVAVTIPGVSFGGIGDVSIGIAAVMLAPILALALLDNLSASRAS